MRSVARWVRQLGERRPGQVDQAGQAGQAGQLGRVLGRPLPRRTLAALLALVLVAVAGTVLGTHRADAVTTRHAQLAVTGLVADGCPASVGGSQIFIHPGDTVEFRPSLAAIKVGAIKIAGNGLLPGVDLDADMVASLNSDLTFADQKDTVHLETSASADGDDRSAKASYTRKFDQPGVYDFGWQARSLNLLPTPLLKVLLGNLLTVPLSADIPGLLNADASLSWGGQVVVSDKAEQCGLSVQVPGVTVRPTVAGVPLPTLSVPGQTLPTVALPSLSLPGAQTSTGKPGSSAPTDSRVLYTPGTPGVKERVMPNGNGGADGAGAAGTRYPSNAQVIETKVNGTAVRIVLVDGKTVAAEPVANERADSAFSSDSATVPIALVLLALVMLSAATGAYARRFIAAKH